MKTCPKCNTLHSKPGIFCTRTCANSRAWSDQDKANKSIANLGKCGKPGPRPPLSDSHKEKIKIGMSKRTTDRFSKGLISERSALRKCLTNIRSYKCDCCGISEYNNNPITLQVDHKDGNAGNNLPDNLRLICPNCHSQTLTFGARNKGNGRAARGLPLR